MLNSLKRLLLRPRKFTYRYRSAVTGLFVSEAYAKAFPDICVRERVG